MMRSAVCRLCGERVLEVLAPLHIEDHKQAGEVLPPLADPLPLHRTEAGYPSCSTCDGGGCPDCTDPT